MNAESKHMFSASKNTGVGMWDCGSIKTMYIEEIKNITTGKKIFFPIRTCIK